MRISQINSLKSRRLTEEDNPFDLSHWQDLYVRTIGCVGVLKDWLTKALAEAIESGEQTLSPTLLEHHAISVDRCDQMITDIEEGERLLKQDEEADYRLRVRLGLEPHHATPAGNGQQDHSPNKSVPRIRNRSVGQRKANRDPVKSEGRAHV